MTVYLYSTKEDNLYHQVKTEVECGIRDGTSFLSVACHGCLILFEIFTVAKQITSNNIIVGDLFSFDVLASLGIFSTAF